MFVLKGSFLLYQEYKDLSKIIATKIITLEIMNNPHTTFSRYDISLLYHFCYNQDMKCPKCNSEMYTGERYYAQCKQCKYQNSKRKIKQINKRQR